jgi:hypothetical protein
VWGNLANPVDVLRLRNGLHCYQCLRMAVTQVQRVTLYFRLWKEASGG